MMSHWGHFTHALYKCCPALSMNFPDLYEPTLQLTENCQTLPILPCAFLLTFPTYDWAFQLTPASFPNLRILRVFACHSSARQKRQ